MPKAEQHPLESVLRQAIDNAEGGRVSVGELLDLYEDRSFGPIFALFGLITVIPPISAIPGLPSLVGAILLLFSAQMLVGHDHVWAPKFVETLSAPKRKLEQAHKRSAPVLKRMDRMITQRLTWATSEPARRASALIVTLLALALMPLELVPFAVAIPGAAITMIGVAILARDGALMLLAWALSLAAFYVLIFHSPLGGWIGL
ncbi:MAG: exopolysaccharide biosynthesis protein [Hyphomonadaceae bacterium]